jgi:hypothetical protein
VPAHSSSLLSFSSLESLRTSKSRVDPNPTHSNLCKLTATGPLFSTSVIHLASLLKQTAQHIKSTTMTEVSSSSEIHRAMSSSTIPSRFYVSGVDAEGADSSVQEARALVGAVSVADMRISESGNALNPFKLVVSDPMDSMMGSQASVEMSIAAPTGSGTNRQSGGTSSGNNIDSAGDSDGLYFVIKSNMSLQDFDFGYAYDAIERSEEGRVVDGLVVTDVMWREDMAEGIFNVETIQLPRRYLIGSASRTLDEDILTNFIVPLEDV